MTVQTEEAPAKAEKPRGACTGCKFEYQLSRPRSGDYKGQLVTRKHLSRVGPGECAGSQKPPRGATPAVGEAFADPAPVQEQAPYITATYDSMGSCGHDIMTGEEIRPDGEDGWLCGLCSDEGPKPDRPQHVHDDGNGGVYVHEGLLRSCALPECQTAAGCSEQLPHDRAPETVNVPGAPVVSVQEIPNGHDFTDSSGATFRHGGEFADCTTTECVQFRNRLNPPPVNTPVQHQCEHGLYAEIRNCPGHGVVTPSVPLGQVFADPTPAPAFQPGTMTTFVDPAQAPADLPSVSGQPEPKRDRWGRYMILGEPHTRTTTFVKLGSSTYALGEWNERMLIAGLVKRPDLLAMAHGLDVKRDKNTLNKIADDAQEFAGNKVAANIGTAYHSFTERLDAGLCTLDDVPSQWRPRCKQYVDALAEHGLTTRREWIERTTGVRSDQVSAPLGVAGTLDRIFQLPDGDLVIGDLKTSSNIEYGWSEIAAQLAVYAHGVNTFGLFDWNTETWQNTPHANPLRVRTDYAIVMHLPADGDGCTLYKVDLVKGWKFAHVSGQVQARQKAKDVASAMVPPPRPAPLPQTVPAPVLAAAEGPAPVRPELSQALILVQSQTHPDQLMPLHQYAVDSGLFTEPELEQIKAACADRWAELNIPF